MMNPPKALADRFEKEVLVANTLWDELEIGQERLPYTSDMLARRVNAIYGTDMRHELVARYIEKMIEDGSIVRRGPVYGSNENGLGIGRNYAWKLVVPLEEALERLARRQERDAASYLINAEKAVRASAEKRRGKRQPRKADVVALANRDEEEARAIAGPEPESAIATQIRKIVPKLNNREAEALVEAARQYANRGTSIKTQIDQLVKTAEDMGLTVDRTALEKTLSFQPDERLENVALVLPVIDALQNTIDRQVEQIRAQSAKYADYDEIKRALRHFREERDRKLVSGVSASH